MHLARSGPFIDEAMVLQPIYFIHYSLAYSLQLVPMDMILAFDTMVPMCYISCVWILKKVLVVLRGLWDVIVDLHNQHITLTSHVDHSKHCTVWGALRLYFLQHLMQQFTTKGLARGRLYAKTCYIKINYLVYRPEEFDKILHANVQSWMQHMCVKGEAHQNFA
jgi:hypothetical protein